MREVSIGLLLPWLLVVLFGKQTIIYYNIYTKEEYSLIWTPAKLARLQCIALHDVA
jgi:hypothetical protein